MILTRQRALADLRAVTVAPITTSVRHSPAFVPLSIEDGLFADCAVNCDAITTIPTTALGALITQMTASKLREVHSAIRYALSIRSVEAASARPGYPGGY